METTRRWHDYLPCENVVCIVALVLILKSFLAVLVVDLLLVLVRQHFVCRGNVLAMTVTMHAGIKFLLGISLLLHHPRGSCQGETEVWCKLMMEVDSTPETISIPAWRACGTTS